MLCTSRSILRVGRREGSGRDYPSQRRLDPSALEQPLREAGALTQLGDRDFQDPDIGVQIPTP